MTSEATPLPMDMSGRGEISETPTAATGTENAFSCQSQQQQLLAGHSVAQQQDETGAVAVVDNGGEATRDGISLQETQQRPPPQEEDLVQNVPIIEKEEQQEESHQQIPPPIEGGHGDLATLNSVPVPPPPVVEDKTTVSPLAVVEPPLIHQLKQEKLDEVDEKEAEKQITSEVVINKDITLNKNIESQQPEELDLTTKEQIPAKSPSSAITTESTAVVSSDLPPAPPVDNSTPVTNSIAVPLPPPPPPADNEAVDTLDKQKPTGSRRVFQCSSCNTYYEDWNLFLHMRNVHNRFICLLCLGLFPNAKRLAKHLLNRHGLKDNQFQSTTDMMEWNEQRPCHMMCVACESVEECVDGEQAKVHSCGGGKGKGPKAVGGGKAATAAAVTGACTKCGAMGAHLCTAGKSSSGGQKAKKRKQDRISDGLSSDLVTGAAGGVKLKIKGLMSGGGGGQKEKAVMAEDGQEANQGFSGAGDDNNNMDRGGGDDTGDKEEEEAQQTPSPEKPFSFNFILSKKGLVRNPNPTRNINNNNKLEAEENSRRHSQDQQEDEEEQLQEKENSCPEGQQQVNGEEEEKRETVPPLLVSKLKLKIPKYIVPVESEEDEDDEEDDEEESDEDEDDDEEEEGEVKLEGSENLNSKTVNQDDQVTKEGGEGSPISEPQVGESSGSVVKSEEDMAVDRDKSVDDKDGGGTRFQVDGEGGKLEGDKDSKEDVATEKKGE